LRVAILFMVITILVSVVIAILVLLKLIPFGFFFVVFLPFVFGGGGSKKIESEGIYERKFCPNCGFPLVGYENFCPRCGVKLR